MKPALLIPLSAAAILAADYREPSALPPAGLSVEEVPMFVSIGFDDNSHAGYTYPNVEGQSINWIRTFTRDLKNSHGTGNAGTFDGAPVRFSFFQNTCYITHNDGIQPSDYVGQLKVALNLAHAEGHEIGNHTHSHITSYQGPNFSETQWLEEIQLCNEWLTKPAPPLEDSVSLFYKDEEGAGIPTDDIKGFRTPYLFYNDNTFTALINEGFEYDCSIEDGFQYDMDGTNFLWPYTLDNGSPGHDFKVAEGLGDERMAHVTIGNHPGLWELPDHPVIVPHDSVAAEYGVEGLRGKLKALRGGFDEESGKITGLDYNMWFEYQLTKEEFLAVMKHTLDLRLQGNRAPFLFGAHSQYYNDLWNGGFKAPTAAERQWAMEEFIKYALSKPEVRLVPYSEVLDWLKAPVALSGTTPVVADQRTIKKAVSLSVIQNSVSIRGISAGTVELFSARGERIIQENFTNGEIDLPNSLAKGAYLISIVGNNTAYRETIILK